MTCAPVPANATELDVADVMNRVSRINVAIAGSDIKGWTRLMREVFAKWPWAIPGDIRLPRGFYELIKERMETEYFSDMTKFSDGEIMFRRHKVLPEE